MWEKVVSLNITPKERNLIKGAIRRVFSRSELRQSVLEAARIDHFDPERPRVTKWCRCSECKQPVARYQAEVDHTDPIVPVNKSLEMMTWDEIINRIFCNKNNLRLVCKLCHTVKTKAETKERAKARKERKNVKGP